MKRIFLSTFLILGVFVFATACSTTANTTSAGGWDNTTAGTQMGTAGLGTDNTTIDRTAPTPVSTSEAPYGVPQPGYEGATHGSTAVAGTSPTSGTVTTTAGTTVGLGGTTATINSGGISHITPGTAKTSDLAAAEVTATAETELAESTARTDLAPATTTATTAPTAASDSDYDSRIAEASPARRIQTKD